MEYNGERFLPEACEGEMAIEHYQRYQFASQLTAGKIVLDAACGEGYGSRMIAENAQKVIGLDIDKEAVRNANIKYGSDKLSFVEGSVGELPFEDASFDVVISYETIEHVDETIQNAFIKEIKRVLKPSGLLIMSTPNKAVYTDSVSSKNEFHIKEFYVEEYVKFLNKNFENVELFCQFPDTGYFILKEEQVISVSYTGQSPERSRYVIAICSDCNIAHLTDISCLTCFSDQMYYFLNKSVHELEEKLVMTKTEADAFQEQQEKAISAQKEYIEKMEKNILTQQEYITHLEEDLSVQARAIAQRDKDIKEQKGYITHLEGDLSVQARAIAQRDKDIEGQKGYIAHLEKDIAELKEHIRKERK